MGEAGRRAAALSASVSSPLRDVTCPVWTWGEELTAGFPSHFTARDAASIQEQSVRLASLWIIQTADGGLISLGVQNSCCVKEERKKSLRLGRRP